MVNAVAKPAETAPKPKLPKWRVAYLPINGEEFVEMFETEADALKRVDSVCKQGFATESGTDRDSRPWTRCHPLAALRYIEVGYRAD